MNALKGLGKQDDETAANKTEESESAPEVESTAAETATYSCHPIQRLKVAGHQFERGVLNLSGAEAIEAFDAFLEKLPGRDRAQIQKINLDAAAKIAAKHQQASTMVRGVSTAGSENAPTETKD